MQANTLKYEAAQRAIADGYWSVDAIHGWLIGRHGHRIGTVQPTGYVTTGAPHRYWAPGTSLYVHRVIWESVHGILPSDLQVNHINGVKHDNRIANLEAVTCSENSRHAVDVGLMTAVGERHPKTHLREAQVLEIYARAWRGESMERIGAEFGVVQATVARIKHGGVWRRVTGHDKANPPKRPPRPDARLTEAQVMEIYRLAKSRLAKYDEITTTFGVDKATVSEIKHGVTWGWLTGEPRRRIRKKDGRNRHRRRPPAPEAA